MKGINSNKIIYGSIIILILIGVVFVYLSHPEKENFQTTPPIEKDSKNDSTHYDRDATPVELGAKPVVDPKDGSLKIVEEFIKNHAKNPSTFKFIEWSEVSTEGKYWKVRCKYKGVSSFNAEVTTNAWFYIQNNKIVYTKIISKI